MLDKVRDLYAHAGPLSSHHLLLLLLLLRRYGKPNASDEEVIAASRMAHLHEAVLRMLHCVFNTTLLLLQCRCKPSTQLMKQLSPLSAMLR